MFKEPLSWIYRQRGRAGRIKRLKRKHVYDMFASEVLRVVKKTSIINQAVPFKAWRNKKYDDPS
jgi:hypothetical protein